MHTVLEKLRDAWYNLAARRVVGASQKRAHPDTMQNMRRVPGVVDNVKEFGKYHSRNGGAFRPVLTRVRYMVDGQPYSKREFLILYEEKRCPHENEDVLVVFPEGRPRQATMLYSGEKGI